MVKMGVLMEKNETMDDRSGSCHFTLHEIPYHEAFALLDETDE